MLPGLTSDLEKSLNVLNMNVTRSFDNIRDSASIADPSVHAAKSVVSNDDDHIEIVDMRQCSHEDVQMLKGSVDSPEIPPDNFSRLPCQARGRSASGLLGNGARIRTGDTHR